MSSAVSALCSDALSVPVKKRIEFSDLTLTLFRNYEHLDLQFGSSSIVLTGENGSGKTNLLEALSYFSPGRGFRRASYDQVISTSATEGMGWGLHAHLDGGQGLVSIGTGLSSSGGVIESSRRVHIDKTRVRSTDSLLDHCRIVWLTPAMDSLFTGPSRERRRFLDRLVLALDSSHSKRVRDFEKAMRSRNHLLEDTTTDPVWLDSVESQMAQSAIAILYARCELIDLLSSNISATDSDSVFPLANLSLDGWFESRVGCASAISLEDEYRAILCDNRLRDRSAGRAIDGPHNTNFLVSHRTKNMSAHLCSTGEQKALLIGLLLSHIRLVSDTTGMIPVLLLDEIAAHLDESRRSSLFCMISDLGCQSFMTGTDSSLFSSLGSGSRHFVVSDGTIVEGREF